MCVGVDVDCGCSVYDDLVCVFCDGFCVGDCYFYWCCGWFEFWQVVGQDGVLFQFGFCQFVEFLVWDCVGFVVVGKVEVGVCYWLLGFCLYYFVCIGVGD